jgi:hypothetical protein
VRVRARTKVQPVPDRFSNSPREIQPQSHVVCLAFKLEGAFSLRDLPPSECLLSLFGHRCLLRTSKYEAGHTTSILGFSLLSSVLMFTRWVFRKLNISTGRIQGRSTPSFTTAIVKEVGNPSVPIAHILQFDQCWITECQCPHAPHCLRICPRHSDTISTRYHPG